MSRIFKDQYGGETLDDFLLRAVRPTREEKESFGEDVDTIVKFLQTELSQEPYTVAEVYKGGSQKKGTAVHGSSDIDLVVFMNGINDIEDLQHVRERLLQRIIRKIKQLGWRQTVEPEFTYPKMKKFGASCVIGEHTVDILPAFNVVQLYGSPRGVYEAMERFRIKQPKKLRRKLYVGMEFSASLSPLQVDFIKEIPGYVKDVIRLLKKWKKERCGQRNLIPSYCMELLATYQWKQTGSTCTSIDKLFRAVMTMLADCRSIQVAMSYNGEYDVTEFTKGRSHPYILDPVNPYNNTLTSRTTDYARLEAEARKTLQELNRH